MGSSGGVSGSRIRPHTKPLWRAGASFWRRCSSQSHPSLRGQRVWERKLSSALAQPENETYPTLSGCGTEQASSPAHCVVLRWGRCNYGVKQGGTNRGVALWQNFTWTNAAGGDWSVASNWSPSILNPPRPERGYCGLRRPEASSGYTVTVGGTAVDRWHGRRLHRRSMPLRPPGRPGVFHQRPLTADIIYVTDAGGPATSMMVEAGGSLFVPTLLCSFDASQTVTISGRDAGGHLELGDLTVGGSLRHRSLMTLDFDNAGLTGSQHRCYPDR